MSERRHILHVFSTFEVGGPQIRFVRLAHALGQKYRHSIITLDGNTDALRHLDPGLDVSMVELPVFKSATLFNIGATLRYLVRIRRAIAALQPDLLCTYNWGAIEWALVNRFAQLVPQIQVEDGFLPDEADRQLPRRVWARRLALGCCRVLVPSLTLRRIALETWQVAPPCVLYVPNGIAVERFALHAADRRPLAIGTLTLRAEKNIGRLMRAFAALPREIDAELVVIGGGPLLETLRCEAARIDPRIRFPGPAPDPAEALKALDLFALSSDTEQMPLSILEAMAAGLPIVSTDVGDVRNMLPAPSRRWVTPRGNDHAFADALARLAADPVERRVLSEANRAHVAATYTESAMLAAWDRLFAGA